MFLFRISCCLLSVAIAAPFSQAGVMLRLVPESQIVESGVPFSLELYFAQDDGEITASGGLFSGGAKLLVETIQERRVTVNSGRPNTGIDEFTFSFGVVYPIDAEFPPSIPQPGLSELVGVFELAKPGVPVMPLNDEIFLAEFQITATGTPGTEIEFTASTLQAPFIGLFAANGDDFDVITTDGRASVTITGVVPEPGSMLIWAGLVGTPLVIGSRRRKVLAQA